MAVSLQRGQESGYCLVREAGYLSGSSSLQGNPKQEGLIPLNGCLNNRIDELASEREREGEGKQAQDKSFLHPHPESVPQT